MGLYFRITIFAETQSPRRSGRPCPPSSWARKNLSPQNLYHPGSAGQAAIYSDSHGSKQVLELTDLVKNLLNDVNISLENNYKLVAINQKDTSISRSKNGDYYISENHFIAFVGE